MGVERERTQKNNDAPLVSLPTVETVSVPEDDPFAVIEAEAKDIIAEASPTILAHSSMSAESLLDPIPREEYVHNTPDIDDRIPEQLRADWKEHGVNLRPGATAADLATIRRSVLGARGIKSIEQTESRIAKEIAIKEAERVTPAKEEAPQVETPLVAQTPAVEKTQEELRFEEMATYDQEWSNLSVEQRNMIVAGIIKSYAGVPLGAIKVKRTNGAIEIGSFGGILPNHTDVLVLTGAGPKSVPILEFVSMNSPHLLTEAMNVASVGDVTEPMSTAEVSVEKAIETNPSSGEGQVLLSKQELPQQKVSGETREIAEEPLSPYDIALNNIWLNRDEHVDAPDLTLEPMERTAKESSELDEVGTLWASFISREYGMDIDGNNIVEPTEHEIVKRVHILEALPTPSPSVGAPQSEILPLHHAVAKQFSEKFNIDESALEKIPEFASLTPGKQLLVLRNLEQLTLSGVTEEAKAKQRAEWGSTHFLMRAGQMLFTLGMEPELRVAELEKKLLAQARGTDKSDPESVRREAMKLAHIEALAKVAQVGPTVKTSPEGKLEVEFCNPKEIFTAIDDPFLTPERLRAVEEFNHASNAYASIPHEWKYQTTELEGKERAQLEAARYAFETTGAKVTQIMKEKFLAEGDSMPDERAMLAMNKFEERVQLSQLFNSHPDAEHALGQISDTSILVRAGKEFWKAKGSFAAYGIVGRAAVVALVGPLAMSAVGASLIAGGAGVMGYGVGMGIGTEEAKRVMKERRARGRMSEDDEREEVVYQKTKDGIPTGQTGTRQIKEFTDATFFTDRIERLNEKLEITKDPGVRALLEKKMAKTVSLMAFKLEAGMINFGGSSDSSDSRQGASIANRLHFMQAIAEGTIATRVDRAELDNESKRIVGLHQAQIEETRKEEIAHIVSRSAMIRGLFALAGASIKPLIDIVSTPSVQKVASGAVDTVVEKPKDYIVPPKTAVAPLPPISTSEAVITVPQKPVTPNVPTSPDVMRPTAPEPPVAGIEKSSALVPLKPPQMSDADVPRSPQAGQPPAIETSVPPPHSKGNFEIGPDAVTVKELMGAVTSYESQVGRDLSGGEMVTVKSIKTLQINTNGEEAKGLDAAMISAMKAKGTALTGIEIYNVLKQFNLEDTVVIAPDETLRTLGK